MKKQSTTQKSQRDIKLQRFTFRSLIPLLILAPFSAGILGAIPTKHPIDARTLVWAVSSILLMLGLVWIYVISYHRSDELQRHDQLKAAAISFAVVMPALSTAGILNALKLGNLESYVSSILVGGLLLFVVVSIILSKRTSS